ncbi:DUF86 domain-containing protein [Leptolyngbyaceae cyanobacterium UHCC 1019]
MSRSFQLYLSDILLACAKVLRYTNGMSFEQFVADDRTFDAVVRNLQIIGEAVKTFLKRFAIALLKLNGGKIAGLRDILAHTYFQVENEIIWDVIQTKLQSLQKKIQDLLEAEAGDRNPN